MSFHRHGSTKPNRWKAVTFACLLLTFTLGIGQVVPCSRAPEGPKQLSKACWQVSNMGRCRDTRGKVTLGSVVSAYRQINIAGGMFAVHRLVAWAFLGPPHIRAACQVNHLDGNHSNTQLSNLAWVTPSQNMKHARCLLPRRKGTLHTSRPVSVNGTRFSSIRLAARTLGHTPETVARWCRRKTQADDCEYKICQRNQKSVPGEEWRPMLNPKTGAAVSGRMVSSCGRITAKNGYKSFGCLNRAGYLVTNLVTKICEPSIKRIERVHRLVAYAFQGPPPTREHTQINHIDSNRTNNSLSNLEYVTPSENVAHGWVNRKARCKPVLSRTFGSRDGWKHHPSIKKAAEDLGLQASTVSACARGKGRQTGGYEFRFAEETEEAKTLPGEEWRDVDVTAHLRDRNERIKKLPGFKAMGRFALQQVSFESH